MSNEDPDDPHDEDLPIRRPVHLGLKLKPTNLLLSKKKQESIQAKWETVDAVEDEIAQMGLPIGEDKPLVSYPATPTGEELTTADSKDYTEKYAVRNAWHGYLAPIVAQLKARLSGISNEKKDIETAIRQDVREKNKGLERTDKISEEASKELVWQDARYKELTILEQRLTQKKLLVESYLERIIRDLNLTSRQVELRRQEQEQGKVENNMPNRHRGRTL